MAYGTINRNREIWRWLRAGQNRIMPIPDGSFDVADLVMLTGFIYVITTCAISDFETMLLDDIDDIFINTLEFARIGYYIDVDDNMYALNGIFDDPTVMQTPSTTIGIQSIGPTFKCSLANIKALSNGVRKGDRLKICGQVYRVIESQSDGVGITTLILHKP